jgi:hypothetical protein
MNTIRTWVSGVYFIWGGKGGQRVVKKSVTKHVIKSDFSSQIFSWEASFLAAYSLLGTGTHFCKTRGVIHNCLREWFYSGGINASIVFSIYSRKLQPFVLFKARWLTPTNKGQMNNNNKTRGNNRSRCDVSLWMRKSGSQQQQQPRRTFKKLWYF